MDKPDKEKSATHLGYPTVSRHSRRSPTCPAEGGEIYAQDGMCDKGKDEKPRDLWVLNGMMSDS